MNNLLINIQKIGHLSGALCILKALRSKIELGRNQPNRLTKHFPNLKLVVLTGRAGGGKTWVMKTIYNGLELHQTNENGIPTAIWLDGASTVVGRREKFKNFPHSVFLWNELNVSDSSDIRLLKQTTEGVISYLKHGDLDETSFDGLIICNCNEFAAKGRAGKDLEALRDRSDIIEVGAPPGYKPELAIEDEKHYLPKTKPTIDWELISDALVRDTDEVLTDGELASIRPFWLQKVRECLDGRILTRAGNDYIDCFVFCKRFFGSLDEPDVFNAAVNLAHDSVTISPIPLAHLVLVQRDIIDALNIAKNKTASTDEIRTYLYEVGRFTSNRSLSRHLSKLVEDGFIVKIGHGEYSLLQPKIADIKTIDKFEELLKSLK